MAYLYPLGRFGAESLASAGYKLQLARMQSRALRVSRCICVPAMYVPLPVPHNP